jgi:CubicO group peptidase (beta-lactamase class C family)
VSVSAAISSQHDSLAACGLDRARWEQVERLAREFVADGVLPEIVLQCVSADATGPLLAIGRRAAGDFGASRPTAADTIFLTASLSKPIVAMGLLLLVERGRVSLADRVCDIVPEFSDAPKRPITLRHLLTHTSGLPDMLPNNRALRQRQAPLADFVSGACGVSLDFPCGRGVQYQSMGYALLGEIIARVTGMTCARFLTEELFAPLGMVDSALGLPEEWLQPKSERLARLAPVRLPQDQVGGDDWNWNSRYWRTLGAPWGGVFSTAGDLSLFLRMMLCDGRFDGGQLFSPTTITAATTNQLEFMHDVPEADRRTRGWGLGWRLNWAGHPAAFGDLLSPQTYGHWGATGTLWWVDPVRHMGLVLLTTQSLERDQTHHLRLSNAVAACLA